MPFAKGDEVILVGLSAAASRNGQVGILGDGPNAKGRWPVQLATSAGKMVSIKAENLQLNMNECANPSCGKRGAGYLVCGGCKQVRYCTKECQVAHWKGAGGGSKHKVACSAKKAADKQSSSGAKGEGGGLKTLGLKGAAVKENSDERAVDVPDAMPKHDLGRKHDSAKDVKHYTKAAEQGDANAQYILGGMYYHGDGVKQDYGEAVKYLKLAAEQGEQGNAAAQNNLGVMYQTGHGVKQDYGEAAKYYRLAADQGHAVAQYNLGVMYESGHGVKQDFEKAAKYCRLAADQGEAVAQTSLGFMYETGHGVKQDFGEAVKYFRLSAEQGNAFAQNNLGVMYKNGHGVKQDYAKALKHFTLAADQGHADAQTAQAEMRDKLNADRNAEKRIATNNSLGDKFFKKGDQQDYGKAFTHYITAANLGNPHAQCRIAQMYENSYGVQEDTDQALAFFTLAADQGYAEGQCGVGSVYEDVDGDYEKALPFYNLAVAQGYAGAQYLLAFMYKDGHAVQKDGAKSVALFTSAAEQGHSDAQELLAWRYMGREEYSLAAKFYKMAADQGVQGALYHFRKATRLAAERGEAAVV